MTRKSVGQTAFPVRGLRSWFGMALAGFALAAAGYHVAMLGPYTPFAPRQSQHADACSKEDTIRAMSANVQATNRDDEAFFAAVRKAEPDILLVLETDNWWHQKTKQLRSSFPYHFGNEPQAAKF